MPPRAQFQIAPRHGRIVISGDFSPEIQTERAAFGFSPDELTRRRMEHGWAQAQAFMDARGWPYWEGPLVRFEGVDISGATLRLRHSSGLRYSQVVGWRALPRARRSRLARNLPHALSAMIVLVTADGRVPLRLRNRGDLPSAWEVGGGFVREEEMNDIASDTLQRLCKDFNLEPASVSGIRCLGIVELPRIGENSVIFAARCGSTYAALKRGKEAGEEWAVAEASRTSQFRHPTHPIHPPSDAALAMYRAYRGLVRARKTITG